MSKTAVLIFCLIFGTESLIICTGNTFTIFVFWNQRSSSLRRTCYLLINLAVVDLLVGVAELIILATENIPLLFGDTSSFDDFVKKAHRVSTLLLMFSTMSIISLAVTSLERALAILRPFVHRTISTRAYIHSIAFVWVSGICVAVMYTLPSFRVWREMYSKIIVNFVVVLCLVMICGSYMAIRSHLKRSLQVCDCFQRRNFERNMKLSKTLFIVIALSIGCWLPALILYIFLALCFNCLPSTVILMGTFLQLGNSVVNPIMYSCRLPMFKKTLNRLLKRRQEDIELDEF